MSKLEFISQIISSLAWPLTVILILFLLRKQIANLFPNLRKFKYKDIELDFSAQTSKIAARAQIELPLPKLQAYGTGTPSIESKRQRLIDLSPRSAILEEWIELEAAATYAIKRYNPDMKSSRIKSAIQIGAALQGLEILNNKQLAIFHDLRNLRNAAAHAANFNVAKDTVEEYIETAGRLVDFLKATQPIVAR